MDTNIELLVREFLPKFFKYIDFGLNGYAILLAWISFLADIKTVISLTAIGLSFTALSYILSLISEAISGVVGISKETIFTDICLIVLGGLASSVTKCQFFLGLLSALITSYICLNRMGLGNEVNQLLYPVLSVIILLFAFWRMVT